MSLTRDVEQLKQRINELTESVNPEKKPRVKPFRVPMRAKSKAKRGLKDGKVLVVWFGSNRHLDFRIGQVDNGLILLEENAYRMDTEAMYIHKKLPAIAIFEWRLEPLGGRADKTIDAYKDISYKELYKIDPVGGKKDVRIAEILKITTYAQQTIIRALKKAIVENEDLKKRKKINPVVWIILAGILLYLLAKATGAA